MKVINWNEEKNKKLKLVREISFEDIMGAVGNGNFFTIKKHPNQEKYLNQQQLIIEIDNYIYVVPFVENDEEIFLKTIYKSRKYTKEYLGDRAKK